jgi:hypothetical protein
MKMKKVYIGIGSLLIVIIGMGFAGIWWFSNEAPVQEEVFDAKKALSVLEGKDPIQDFIEIEKIVAESMKKYGTRAGFEVIDEGERMGIVSNDSCHGLLHYVGHEAYAENPTDYEALLSVVEGTDCIGGYLHGIEAEIVLSSSNMIEDVQRFCTFQKQKRVNPGACYHGVGHAAIELYNNDIPKALALCDALYGEPEKDVTNCYRGIFSELGNGVVGYDGHTGIAGEKLTLEGLDVENPYEYCEQLEEKYQPSCKSQFTKIAITELHPDKWIDTCAKPGLSTATVDICLSGVAGVYVRHHLSFADTTQLPDSIYSFPIAQQKVGILGAAEAFAGYFHDNAMKDWESFCNGIKVEETKAYCTEIFTRVINNNESPWMERTDLR